MVLRISFVFLVIFSSIVGRAQLRFALFGGPQMTTARYLVSRVEQPTQFKFGAMAGAGAKVAFENNIYFFPAVYYSLKGYKVTLNNPSYPPTELAKNNNTTIHTIEFAPLIHIDLSKNPSHLFIRLGPSVDFAFYGTEKFDTSDQGGFAEV